MLSATMMLEYLGFSEESQRFENAIRKVYAAGKSLTADQGGKSKTPEFTAAVIANL
jgi:isocitrate dehydrogenase (NAD+)